MHSMALFSLLILSADPPCTAALAPRAEPYNYTPAMQRVAAGFTGREGVVLHLGDSITFARAYGDWVRRRTIKTARERAICSWMHAESYNDRDGWYLASTARPPGNLSFTAAGGIASNEFLAGSRPGLPSLDAILIKYQPRMCIVLLGTNDASGQRETNKYLADMTTIVDRITARHAIPILSTIPPWTARRELINQYNIGLRRLASTKQIPLIDFEQEILLRRPTEWNGTLMNFNDPHPTGLQGGATSSGPPSPQNLCNCGYLLRGWLSVQKVAEVKERVLDAPSNVRIRR